ncbi:MAG: PatB family C-S lyase [Lachnospiraceae bacterium]|nr:PatB family C-S lyase [Lachnospiraceae bacterium]
MTYDFDRLTVRTPADSVKWDVKPGELPMWVADMDFDAAPEIREALQARLDRGVFGYQDVTQAWRDAYCGWWQSRHGLAMDPDGLLFATGVIPILSSCVRKLTTPAEKILLMTPVYNHFFISIRDNGREVLSSRLLETEEGYSIDFADLEEKLADPQTALLFLCNPHNPIGRAWDRETLARIGALCEKHHVTVIADEIHCDVTDPGVDYVPFASVDDTCARISVTAIAPTKAFNLAGLHTAAAYVPDPVLRHKVRVALNTGDVGAPNTFAVEAAVAAFTKGGDWLDAVRAYIKGNKDLVRSAVREKFPQLRVVPSDSTYLLWLDVRGTGMDGKAFAHSLRERTGLFLTRGDIYGAGGEDYIRWNLAAQRSRVEDALSRLETFFGEE